jgi:hypothetical protein
MRFPACIPIFVCAAFVGTLFAGTDRFAAIDRHAIEAPRSAEKSVRSLALYLVRPARNDEERARAIFRWIAQNISYDTRGYFAGKAGPSSPNSVLQNKTAACDGFSGLFTMLGREAGLEISQIGGYAKGYGSSVGEHFSGPPDHAWNAVKIDGAWRLMDATWGSGYVDENGRYIRSFDDYFFFTPPEKLIYTHFPENPEWQLLSRRVSLDEFEKMAFVRPGFFEHGLELDSHPSSEFESTDTVKVMLRAPDETVMLAQLIRNGKILGSDLTFVQKEGGRAMVRAAFPAPGAYVLRIFAKRKSGDGKAGWVLDYRIKARKNGRDTPTFPETYRDFMERDGFLESPMQGRLTSGKVYRFRLRIPGAENAMVSLGNRWIDLKKTGLWFEGKVTAGQGEIHVFAKFPQEKLYSGLLKYIGE